MVLGFYEMPEEDRPRREDWLDEEALAQHFDDVRERHRTGMEPVPDLMQNELTRGLKN